MQSQVVGLLLLRINFDTYTVATLRAGFKPIWPISSNRDPRGRGPRAKPQHKFSLVSSWLWIFPARGPAFFKGFWEIKTVLKLFQQSLKTVQTRFTTTIKIHENLALQIISVFR